MSSKKLMYTVNRDDQMSCSIIKQQMSYNAKIEKRVRKKGEN